MSASMRVLLALALAVGIGVLLALQAPELAARVAAIAQPIGKLWLNALQMTVVPLVGALVVLGVNTASHAAASGRLARRAIVLFLLVLLAAAAFAAVVAPWALAQLPRNADDIQALRAAMPPLAETPKVPALGDWLAGIVPSNALAAAVASAMLPLVVSALFFGFALQKIADPGRARLLELVQAIADTMIVIVRWVLAIAPLGVFALMLAVTAGTGLHMLRALVTYIVLLCAMYLAVTALMYPLAMVLARTSLRRFAAAIAPAQGIAASTQSSLATLPAMLDAAHRRLGVPLPVASLVLPMAVSLFRLTSPVQYIGVSAFIAWLYGVDIGAMQWATAVVLAAVVSLGSVGLPGQVSFMATNMPVAQSLGLPLDPIAILLAVDTIPDAFATLGNVTADLAATGAVAAREGPDGDAAS